MGLGMVSGGRGRGIGGEGVTLSLLVDAIEQMYYLVSWTDWRHWSRITAKKETRSVEGQQTYYIYLYGILFDWFEQLVDAKVRAADSQIIPWTRFEVVFVVVHRMQCQSWSQVKSELWVHPPTQSPTQDPRAETRTGLQLPEVIHWRRLEKSAKQSIGCDSDFDGESLLELKSRPRHILLEWAIICTYICSYTVIGFFDFTLIQLKSYAIESMLKLLERWERCVEVSKCWKTKSLLKLAASKRHFN